MSCVVQDCDRRPVNGRGMCGGHYDRWRKWGDVRADVPLQTSRPPGMTAEETFTHFMGHVPPESGCWAWPMSTDTYGYGIVYISSGGTRRRAKAHRLSYQMHNGPIPDGLVVRHSCDNPRCCQPQHLLVGTMADNTGDMLSRKRHSHGSSHNVPRGERHTQAKLTESEVIQIRRLSQQGLTAQALADRFGVSRGHVAHILRRRVWKDI